MHDKEADHPTVPRQTTADAKRFTFEMVSSRSASTPVPTNDSRDAEDAAAKEDEEEQRRGHEEEDEEEIIFVKMEEGTMGAMKALEEELAALVPADTTSVWYKYCCAMEIPFEVAFDVPERIECTSMQQENKPFIEFDCIEILKSKSGEGEHEAIICKSPVAAATEEVTEEPPHVFQRDDQPLSDLKMYSVSLLGSLPTVHEDQEMEELSTIGEEAATVEGKDSSIGQLMEEPLASAVIPTFVQSPTDIRSPAMIVKSLNKQEEKEATEEEEVVVEKEVVAEAAVEEETPEEKPAEEPLVETEEEVKEDKPIAPAPQEEEEEDHFNEPKPVETPKNRFENAAAVGDATETIKDSLETIPTQEVIDFGKDDNEESFATAGEEEHQLSSATAEYPHHEAAEGEVVKALPDTSLFDTSIIEATSAEPFDEHETVDNVEPPKVEKEAEKVVANDTATTAPDEDWESPVPQEILDYYDLAIAPTDELEGWHRSPYQEDGCDAFSFYSTLERFQLMCAEQKSTGRALCREHLLL